MSYLIHLGKDPKKLMVVAIMNRFCALTARPCFFCRITVSWCLGNSVDPRVLLQNLASDLEGGESEHEILKKYPS